MSSKKLRKYLAYYRKTLSEDPENIEARLRLAALFREMERPSHAIDEYGTAAKLLASEGLPLEAIAACKAILELDPSHRETQLFLARLYAQVPEATGDSVRVAKPVDPDQSRGVESSSAGLLRNEAQVVDEAGHLNDERGPITLDKPKTGAESVSSNDASTFGEAASEEETDPDVNTAPLESEKIPRFQGPTTEMDAQTRAAHQAMTREESVHQGGADDGDDTRLQASHAQDELRGQSIPEQDRETIDLGVFDLDSLELEQRETGQWQNLEFLDDVDEPDTREIELAGDSPSADGVDDSAQREFRVSALPRIPLFSQLPRQVFVEMLDAMELKKLPAATEILRPGDPAGCLYVIVAGRVRIEKDFVDGRTRQLAVLGEGEVFGEFRLLTGKGGWARVVAETDLELLVIRDEVVYRIGREYPKLWQVMWGFYYRRMLNHAMASSPLFQMLNREERDLLSEHFELDEIGADETFFERGEEVDSLALIVRGSVDVRVPDGDSSRFVETLDEGALVGVSPCAREVPATATVRSRTAVVFYRMSGTIFRELMYGLPEVAEAVRELVRLRQSRTQRPASEGAMSDRV